MNRMQFEQWGFAISQKQLMRFAIGCHISKKSYQMNQILQSFFVSFWTNDTCKIEYFMSGIILTFWVELDFVCVDLIQFLNKIRCFFQWKCQLNWLNFCMIFQYTKNFETLSTIRTRENDFSWNLYVEWSTKSNKC